MQLLRRRVRLKSFTNGPYSLQLSFLFPIGQEVGQPDMLYGMIDALAWGELWHDADLVPALTYIRNSKHLVLPESFRGLVPTCL